MKIIYKRCSTSEDRQSVDRQCFGLEADKVFTEYASGKDENRPVFQEMIASLKSGDEVFFADLSRCGRNTIQLLTTVENLVAKGITLTFKAEGLVFTGDSEADPFKYAVSQMMLTMLSSVNQLFLAQTKSAVKQGLRKVKLTEPHKLAKGPSSKWAKTFHKNRAAGLHKTTRNTQASAEKKKPVVDAVLKMIRYSSDNLTLAQISNTLTEEGFRTPRNKIYSEAALSRLIKQNNIEYKKKSCKM